MLIQDGVHRIVDVRNLHTKESKKNQAETSTIRNKVPDKRGIEEKRAFHQIPELLKEKTAVAHAHYD